MPIDVIGLDGDDTLWHSESLFALTNDRIRELLAPHVDAETLDERLLDVERQNLALFGYGAKAFTLSVIETAIEVSRGRVTTAEIQAIIDLGKALLAHPVDLLDGVAEAIDALADYRLVLITKGDLFHQESKIAGSGLGEYFESIEIVSEKDPTTYRRVLDGLGVSPDRFLMVGNSLRSDVEPVVAIGGRAVHVPYEHQWALDAEPDGELPSDGWWHLDSLAELPGLVRQLNRPLQRRRM
jgi:putative hydrolase of the HAD superfamily